MNTPELSYHAAPFTPARKALNPAAPGFTPQPPEVAEQLISIGADGRLGLLRALFVDEMNIGRQLWVAPDGQTKARPLQSCMHACIRTHAPAAPPSPLAGVPTVAPRKLGVLAAHACTATASQHE